jgi:branched-chain amino acid transport system substrate-binding protein
MTAALRAIATGKGDAIAPGEWKKAVDDIKAGKDITYTGAGGAYQFDANGDVTGYIGKFVVDGDHYKQTAVMQ